MTLNSDTTPRTPDRDDQHVDTGELVAGAAGELIAVVDGPLAGQWFTWPDWQARLRAADHIADRTGRRSPALDYAPAGYQVANPVLAHTHGWAAVYRPAVQASAGTGHVRGDAEVTSVPVAARVVVPSDDDALDLAG